MQRISIIEAAYCWQLFTKDDRGSSLHCCNLDVQIFPYDDREKRLDLAKERARSLAFEYGLVEYFVLRSGGKSESIVVDPEILMFADHMDLKQTDQAEMMLRSQLFRFAGWDGLRFTRYVIIADESASLAHSPIFQRLFNREGAVFYRLKVIAQEVQIA